MRLGCERVLCLAEVGVEALADEVAVGHAGAEVLLGAARDLEGLGVRGEVGDDAAEEERGEVDCGEFLCARTIRVSTVR